MFYGVCVIYEKSWAGLVRTLASQSFQTQNMSKYRNRNDTHANKIHNDFPSKNSDFSPFFWSTEI